MRSSKSRSRNKSSRQRTLVNIVNRVFDSSGPEGKVRGTPQQIIEKYLMLARDAQLSHDRVAEQSFFQHAEHYTRMLAEAQRELAERQGQFGNQAQGHGRQNGDDDRDAAGNGGGGGQNSNAGQNNPPQREGGGFRESQHREGGDRHQRDRSSRDDDRDDDRPEIRNDTRNDTRRDERHEPRREDRNDPRRDDRRRDRRDEGMAQDPAEAGEGTGRSDAPATEDETGLVSTPEDRAPQPRRARAPRPPKPAGSPVETGEKTDARTRAPRRKPASKTDAASSDPAGSALSQNGAVDAS